MQIDITRSQPYLGGCTGPLHRALDLRGRGGRHIVKGHAGMLHPAWTVELTCFLDMAGMKPSICMVAGS